MFKYFIAFGLIVSWIVFRLIDAEPYNYILSVVHCLFMGIAFSRIVNFDKTEIYDNE